MKAAFVAEFKHKNPHRSAYAFRWGQETLCKKVLLEGNLSASFFQLSLSSLSVVLGSAFQNSLRSGLNELLSFLQTQAGNDLADSLNNADLLSASVFDNDVELVLLFLSWSSSTATSNCNSSNCR